MISYPSSTTKALAVASATLALMAAPIRASSAATTRHAKETRDRSSLEAPAPPPAQTWILRIHPETLAGHLRAHWASHGFWSKELGELLLPAFLRPDRPVVIAGDVLSGQPVAIGLTTSQNAVVPNWMRTRYCQANERGVSWCALAEAPLSLPTSEDSYRGPAASADLEIEIPDLLRPALDRMAPWRGEIPRQSAALLSKRSDTDSFAVTALLDGWMYDLHGELLDVVRRIRGVSLALSVDPDGSLNGHGSVPLESAAVLRSALQQHTPRLEYPILSRFPTSTRLAIATDAKVIGYLMRPSARGAQLATELQKGQNAGTIGLITKSAELYSQCFSRSQDATFGWGDTRDFEAPRATAKVIEASTRRNANSATAKEYFAMGIMDRGGGCLRAATSLFGHLSNSSRPIKGDKTQPTLALSTGMITVRRIGEELWFIHAPDQHALGQVHDGLRSTQPNRASRSATKVPAAMVLKTAATVPGDTWQLSVRQDSSSSVIRVSLAADRCELDLRATESVARRAIGYTLMSSLNNQKTARNAELLSAACILGLNDACNGAGIAYLDWENLRDPSKASALLRLACNAEHGMACANLGFALEKSALQESRSALERGCNLGASVACAHLGNQLLDSKDEKDQRAATRILRTACEDKFPGACTNLGYQFATGRGVAVDYDEGIRHYERSCELSHALGCVLLGHLYYDGKARARDFTKAYSLYLKACNLDYNIGCHASGLMLLRGDGVARDVEAAKRMFARACDKGHADSCMSLGDLKGGKQ